MFKRLFKPRTPRQPKPHPFTNKQIERKAYELWQQREPDSTAEENWQDAIRSLRWERRRKWVLRPMRRLWWRMGLGPHVQGVWKWTGLPEKKGWDFAQLLVAPVVLAVIGLGLQEYLKQKDQFIADDKAKQDTLVKYLDQMADSLNNGLRKAKPGEDKFIVAQSRTVLALQSLDRRRQHLVVQFLRASGLSDAPDDEWKPTFDDHRELKDLPAKSRVLLYKAQMEKANLANSDLSGAVLIGTNLNRANLSCDPPDDENKCSDFLESDLRGANLDFANLSHANLSFANLSFANLSFANLGFANLFRANLRGADLKFADLSDGANLSRANLIGAHFWYYNLEGNELAQAKEDAKKNIQSAKNWKDAYYDPEICKLLGIPFKKPPQPKTLTR